MSYHNTSTSQSTTNAQGQIAPAGYHYMPDGSLMEGDIHLADELYSLYAPITTSNTADGGVVDIEEETEIITTTIDGTTTTVHTAAVP